MHSFLVDFFLFKYVVHYGFSIENQEINISFHRQINYVVKKNPPIRLFP